MKSLIMLFMATLMLGSTMLPVFSLEQSAKWGEVIEHYKRHRCENPDLGFVEYLSLHYGAGSDHQKNPSHSHQNLPSFGQSLPVSSPQLRLRMPEPAVSLLAVTSQVFSRKADLYSFLSVRDLINPPRC